MLSIFVLGNFAFSCEMGLALLGHGALLDNPWKTSWRWGSSTKLEESLWLPFLGRGKPEAVSSVLWYCWWGNYLSSGWWFRKLVHSWGQQCWKLFCCLRTSRRGIFWQLCLSLGPWAAALIHLDSFLFCGFCWLAQNLCFLLCCKPDFSWSLTACRDRPCHWCSVLHFSSIKNFVLLSVRCFILKNLKNSSKN